jgi:hypothetical protein
MSSLIEPVCTFLVSRLSFKGRARLREVVGIALLLVGIVMTLTLRWPPAAPGRR